MDCATEILPIENRIQGLSATLDLSRSENETALPSTRATALYPRTILYRQRQLPIDLRRVGKQSTAGHLLVGRTLTWSLKVNKWNWTCHIFASK